MRIACTNHHRQLVGGTESYLKRVIPELVRAGHIVSLWHEGTVSPGAALIDAPEVYRIDSGSPALLNAWKPGLIYSQGLMGMEWEASLAAVAPVVHYAHNYYGTCISGEKTRKFPDPKPCDRCFGPACLAQYLPRRCGGMNPYVMWQDYQLQSQRLKHLRNYSAIVTASAHIENEYRKHGFTRVYRAPLFVEPPTLNSDAIPDRILFSGRMTRLKGGELLLDAIPLVERLLGRPIEVFFAGDGPQRAVWEARKTKAIFTGWISQHALRGLNASLLVMPSVWPEPFGLSALELGMPAAAFRVGGIPEWLRDGVNGHLADSLDAGSLARAIHACLENEAHFHDLQNGAFQVAKEFSMERHLNALLPIFQAACQ